MIISTEEIKKAFNTVSIATLLKIWRIFITVNKLTLMRDYLSSRLLLDHYYYLLLTESEFSM